MNAGDLRERVRIELPSRPLDEVGGRGPEGTPTVVATVWAQVVPLAGAKLAYARSVFETATYRVTIRYRDDVTNAHRLVLADESVLWINDVNDPDRRKRQLDLTCSELVSNA